VGAADTVLVVLVPGLGDDIQAIKAGVLEIADIFVINKADQPGADRLERELMGMLSLGGDPGRQATPILRTVATHGEGIGELVKAVEEHRERRLADGSCQARRRTQGERRFLVLLRDRLVEHALERLREDPGLKEMVTGIQDRRIDPYTAVERVLADLKLLQGS
jgi:LAO/AO transport system kinase